MAMNNLPFDNQQLRKLQVLLDCDPSETPTMDQILEALAGAVASRKMNDLDLSLTASSRGKYRGNPMMIATRKLALEAALKNR